MARTISDPRHKALRQFLVSARKKAGLRQIDVAVRLRRSQDYVSHIETGQKIVGAIELAELAEVIGFDPAEAVRLLRGTAKGRKRGR